jgi:hypothetical protein
VGDVGSAAKAVLLVIEAHHWHGSFGGDAIHPANHKVIEHQVADDEHGAAGEPRGKVQALSNHASG